MKNSLSEEDEQSFINILCSSFFDNPSVNYVIKQDKRKASRLRTLMEYSFFQGEQFGKIYLSEDKLSCAILLNPAVKRTSVNTIFWDLKLVFKCIGLRRISKVLKRESEIKKYHPKIQFTHLWYIGVMPEKQGKGKGKELMGKIMADCKQLDLPVYLETSNPKNFPFYKQLGFEEIASLESLGYDLRMFLWN